MYEVLTCVTQRQHQLTLLHPHDYSNLLYLCNYPWHSYCFYKYHANLSCGIILALSMLLSTIAPRTHSKAPPAVFLLSGYLPSSHTLKRQFSDITGTLRTHTEPIIILGTILAIAHPRPFNKKLSSVSSYHPVFFLSAQTFFIKNTPGERNWIDSLKAGSIKDA
jgi:hypothetical protein